MYDHNNWIHAPISLERTWETKLCPDCNVAWYLAVSEVNTDLASGHFQNDWLVRTSFYFWRALEIYLIENKIGVELGKIGRPKRTYKLPIYVPCEKITVKHHGRMWDPNKKWKKVKQKYQKQRCQNYYKCVKKNRFYCNYSKGLILCSVLFSYHKVKRVTNL